MKHLFSAALAATLTVGALQADHHEDDGWISLFDGKTLDGWKSSTDNPAAFSVEDGMLKVSGERAHLFYVGEDGKASFKDFEFKAKVMTKPKANSGIYFHTVYQADGWPAKGYEAQVNSSQSDPKKTGSIYGVRNVYVDGKTEPAEFEDNGGVSTRRAEAPSKDDEWFDYHIIVKGKSITIKINGETTAEFTEPEGWKGPNGGMRGRILSEGTFALQAHDPGSTAFYKDLKVKPLK